MKASLPRNGKCAINQEITCKEQCRRSQQFAIIAAGKKWDARAASVICWNMTFFHIHSNPADHSFREFCNRPEKSQWQPICLLNRTKNKERNQFYSREYWNAAWVTIRRQLGKLKIQKMSLTCYKINQSRNLRDGKKQVWNKQKRCQSSWKFGNTLPMQPKIAADGYEAPWADRIRSRSPAGNSAVSLKKTQRYKEFS